MRVLIRGVALLGAVVACTGCGPSHPSAASNCPAIDTSACRSPIPAYASDVAPLLDRSCNLGTCHGPGADQWPLTDRNSVAAWQSLVVYDVKNCRMPPADAGMPNLTLTLDERKMLLNWFACGAPND